MWPRPRPAPALLREGRRRERVGVEPGLRYRPWGRLLHRDGVIGAGSRDGGFCNAAHPEMDPLIRGLGAGSRAGFEVSAACPFPTPPSLILPFLRRGAVGRPGDKDIPLPPMTQSFPRSGCPSFICLGHRNPSPHPFLPQEPGFHTPCPSSGPLRHPIQSLCPPLEDLGTLPPASALWGAQPELACLRLSQNSQQLLTFNGKVRLCR